MGFEKSKLFSRRIVDPELHINKNFGLGILLTICAWTASSFANACITLTLDDVMPQTALFFQYLFGFILLLSFLSKNRIKNLKTENLHIITSRAIFGIANNLLLFISFQFIPFIDATLLNNTAPLFIPLLMWLWVGKKMLARQWIAIGIGFLGVLCIIRPDKGILSTASFIALSSGLFAGLSKASLRLLSKEPYFKIMFYYFLFSVLAMFPFIFIKWNPISLHNFLLLGGGGFFLILSQFAFVFSLRFGCASDLAPFNFSFVIASGLLGWLLWNYIPDPLGFTGMFLIILGGFFAVILGKKNQQV